MFPGERTPSHVVVAGRLRLESVVVKNNETFHMVPGVDCYRGARPTRT